RIKGKGGHVLDRDWNGDDARAYLGTVVYGYPNFFCLYGPNTQFGHGGSLITILERQTHYLMSLLEKMFEKNISSVEVRKDVFDNYNKKVDELHSGMVWTFPGVETYYKNAKGRVVVNNPFRVLHFWEMTENVNMNDYQSSEIIECVE
ncbi:MAG: monooxygenase, partial [Novosphingobium sp.]|nr:monooxygenase [Novosphingobium sp.]